jgi:ABC-2 type transport system ATP-binding protein
MPDTFTHNRDPVLTVSALQYRMSPSFALQPVSFTVDPGEGVAAIGTNGAGKTTLIRLISGLLRPHAGEARIRDIQAHRSRRVSRYVGYVQQTKELPDGVTVETYIKHQLRLRRADPARYEELLELADLGPYSEQYARRLSGGNQRKVHIICAVAHRPDLLILDEPTAGLDPTSRENLLGLLSDLKKTDVGILFSTHHRDELVALADSVVALHEGRQVHRSSVADFIQLGTRSELRLEPFDSSDSERLYSWALQLSTRHPLIETVHGGAETVRIELSEGQHNGFLEHIVTTAKKDGLTLRSASYTRPSLADIVRHLSNNSGEDPSP